MKGHIIWPRVSQIYIYHDYGTKKHKTQELTRSNEVFIMFKTLYLLEVAREMKVTDPQSLKLLKLSLMDSFSSRTHKNHTKV